MLTLHSLILRTMRNHAKASAEMAGKGALSDLRLRPLLCRPGGKNVRQKGWNHEIT